MVREHQLINLGKLPNHWNDQSQFWRTNTDSPGNGHMLNTINPSSPKGYLEGVGGHAYKNVGKMTNNWTDRYRISHTYAY